MRVTARIAASEAANEGVCNLGSKPSRKSPIGGREEGKEGEGREERARGHPSYGFNRVMRRGKAIASRRWPMSQIQATVRSTPSPNPLCGYVP